MDRDFSPGPEGLRVETEFGNFDVKAVTADAIYVCTPQGSLCVRGVNYNASGHFKKVDGRFIPTDGPTSVSARRDDNFADASAAAVRTITQIFEAGVEQYVQQHPEHLDQAEAASLSNQIMYEDREIAKLEQQLRDANARRNTLRDREATTLERIQSATPAPGYR